MAKRGRGRPRAYTPQQLEKGIQDYFDSITTTYPLFDSVVIGKDSEGKVIYKEVPRLNNKGEQLYGTTYHEHPSFTGLAIYLDINKDTLTEYGNQADYSVPIKRAKQIIENYLESHLYGNNVTGIIFNLKNNYGWKDRQEIDANITVTKGLEDWLDE